MDKIKNDEEAKKIDDLTKIAKFEKLVKLCDEYLDYANRELTKIENKEVVKDCAKPLITLLVDVNFESARLYKRFMQKFGDVRID